MKHKYFVLLFSILILTNPLSAQKKSKKEKKEKAKVEKSTDGKLNLTFTKPKNAWQVGVFGGFSGLFGDVNPNFFYGNKTAFPGHSFGLFVSKSWSYLISTRLRYSTMNMLNTDAVPSTLTHNQINAVNINNDIGFRDLRPGQNIFHNSRTQGHDVNFDLVFTIGNINYHKERSPIVFRFFPTVGMLFYQTFYDQLDADNNPYDYESIENLNELDVTDRAEILTQLNELRDGKFETRAEEHSVYNENQINGYNPRVTFGIGFGTAIRLNKNLSIDIETRQSFANDDLVDGMQWQEPSSPASGAWSRGRTLNLDTYNETTIGLTYSFVSNNVGEALCMQNPLWGTDAFIGDKDDKKDEEIAGLGNDLNDLDSANIKLNDKVGNLEGEIDELKDLIEKLADDKEKDNFDEDVKAYDFDNNPDNLNPEQLAARKQALIRKGKAILGGGVNDLEDLSFKLRDGEYMYVGDLQGDIEAAYYVVTGSFRVKSNAKNDQREWKKKGVDTYLMIEPKVGLYRVIVDYADNREIALDLLESYQTKLLRTIWIIKAE